MAKSEVITINDTTPTLLYRGAGAVRLDADHLSYVLAGGDDVSQSNGSMFFLNISGVHRLGAEDEIYGLLKSPNGDSLTSMDVRVFSTR